MEGCNHCNDSIKIKEQLRAHLYSHGVATVHKKTEAGNRCLGCGAADAHALGVPGGQNLPAIYTYTVPCSHLSPGLYTKLSVNYRFGVKLQLTSSSPRS